MSSAKHGCRAWSGAMAYFPFNGMEDPLFRTLHGQGRDAIRISTEARSSSRAGLRDQADVQKYPRPDTLLVADEDLTFERVTKVYREESGRKTLTSLEADFYDKLAAYLRRLEEATQREAHANPNSPKALLLQDELRKIRKKRDQIFTYRERKLALLASSRASGADVDLPNLPHQEKALFESLVALLRRTREEAFGGSPFGSQPATVAPPPTVPATPAPAPERRAGEPMRVVRPEETRRPVAPPSLKEHVVVHVLEDIPPFAGIDTTYRLKKEDVVTLPKTIAQVLVDRGKARIVQMPGATA